MLEGDSEWVNTLEEAIHTHMCPQIRRMYVIILIFCSPESPRMLFDRFWSTWSDDFKYKAERMSVTLDQHQLKTLVLQDI